MLEITEQLGQALQKKSQDIVNAIRLVQTTKVLLEKMRSDDGWETFFCQVVEFCMNHDILIPNMEETYICVVAVLVVNLNILLRSATIEWRYFVQPLIPSWLN